MEVHGIGRNAIQTNTVLLSQMCKGIIKDAHYFMATFQLMQLQKKLQASLTLQMLMTETIQLGQMDSMTEWNMLNHDNLGSGMVHTKW